MKKKSVIAIIFCLSLIAGGAYWKLTSSSPAPEQPFAMPPAEVEFVRITAQPVTLSKTLPGRTTAYRIAEIRPQVSGIITQRLFQEGSDVVAGQQLYQIDPATYQAAYQRAEADLLKAEANKTSAEAKANRYTELVKIGAISWQDFDDAKATLAQNCAEVAIAKAALSTASIQLDYTKVFSPLSGRIGKSRVSEGALVTANQEAPLTIIQQLDPIYVDVCGPCSDVMKLRRGLASDKLQVALLMEEHEKLGQLQFSDITVDQSTGTLQLRALFENPNHEILPGLFVRARIDHHKEELATLVPQCAATHDPGGNVTVWIVDEDNQAIMQPIKISQAIGDQWLVTEGLKAGDRVVVAGMQKLMPKRAVVPVEK